MPDKIKLSAGIDRAYLDHRSPTDVGNLLPAALGEKISLERHSRPVSSLQVMNAMRRQGAIVQELPLPIYGPGAEGKPRKLDNTDALLGYEPLYEDLPHLESVYVALTKLVPFIRKTVASDPIISSVEAQDLDKITMQRWRGPGWFIHAPFAPDIKQTPYDESFISALRQVIKGYVGVGIEGGANATLQDVLPLMLEDFDPDDTATGMPTLASGVRTMPARLMTLRAYPSPSGRTPGEWLRGIDTLGMSLGLPSGVMTASLLATRHGPTRKPATLWYRDGAMYSSLFSSVGLVDRVRYVYPISYPINFMLSGSYIQLKKCRQKKLGLWHSPDLSAKYIDRLKSQGKTVYTIDFSGMDTTMPPHLITLICEELMSAGFAAWPLQLLIEYYKIAVLLMPSFHASPNSVTAVSKLLGWMSGFKLTSEMDTLFGAATLLSALELQAPGISQRWVNGDFIFLEQGDDILFTWDGPLDLDKLAADAKKLAGADLKVLKDDVLFLKKMMPLVPSVPQLCPPFSRVIQQTFFNEDRYSGEQGGDKPAAILRLGWLARTTGLQHHKFFPQIWPTLAPIVLSLKWAATASSSWKADFSKGVFRLDDGDEQEIQRFAMINTSYLLKLSERAKYEPSAASLLALLVKLGVDISQDAALKQRRVLLEAILQPPTAQDVAALRKEMVWLRPFG